MPSAILGAVGLGKQSAMGSVASTVVYFPATSVGLNMNQNVQTLPPEVGGAYFLRGSYKASVAGGGQIASVARPNSLLYLLWALCGADNATTVASQNGAAFQHILTPFAPAAGADLPWLTLFKDVSKLYGEQYLDSKLQSLSLAIPKSGIVTAQSSWLSATPSALAYGGLPSETQDTTPQFVTNHATFALTDEVGGGTISADSNLVENFQLAFTNNISNDEYTVGSPYMQNITLLQRTATCDMDVVIRDTALYQAIYLNGGSIPASWSPTIYRGTFALTLTSTTYITGSVNQPYSLEIQFPGLDFLMMPVNIAGANLVRATLSTQVTLGPSGSDTFTFTLINGVSASY